MNAKGFWRNDSISIGLNARQFCLHCSIFTLIIAPISLPSVAGAQSLAITKILVANRSEIAIRVFRAANELGLKTVAIWAEEDKYSLHRFKADESYQVGRGPHLTRDMGPIESYLSIEEVIRVARLSGADAIHPGYGLLSESPEFADACAEAGHNAAARQQGRGAQSRHRGRGAGDPRHRSVAG